MSRKTCRKQEWIKKICLLSSSSGFQWSNTDLNIWYQIATTPENEKKKVLSNLLFFSTRREQFSVFRDHEGLVLNTWKNVLERKPSTTFHSINNQFWMKIEWIQITRDRGNSSGWNESCTAEGIDWNRNEAKCSPFVSSLKKCMNMYFNIEKCFWNEVNWKVRFNSPTQYAYALRFNIVCRRVYYWHSTKVKEPSKFHIKLQNDFWIFQSK